MNLPMPDHGCPVCAAKATRTNCKDLTVTSDDLTTAFADAVIARTAEIKFLQTCLELRDGDVAALREENERLKEELAESEKARGWLYEQAVEGAAVNERLRETIAGLVEGAE